MRSPLLRDLAAAVDLPPHSALFALQLLDLTHRRWSESEGPDIEDWDVFLRQRLVFALNCTTRLDSCDQILSSLGSQPVL